MAVVFISPKKRQKVFFMGITVVFLLFVLFISLTVFFSQPKQNGSQLVFNKPKVNIDFTVFASDSFKNLEPFTEMEFQFTYQALTKDNKNVQGLISAVSVEVARTMLEAMDLKVGSIKEVEIGRENPFTPYYQDAIVPADETIVNRTTTR